MVEWELCGLFSKTCFCFTTENDFFCVWCLVPQTFPVHAWRFIWEELTKRRSPVSRIFRASKGQAQFVFVSWTNCISFVSLSRLSVSSCLSVSFSVSLFLSLPVSLLSSPSILRKGWPSSDNLLQFFKKRHQSNRSDI